MSYTIPGHVYKDAVLIAWFDLAYGAELHNEREASQLVNSYIASLLIQGGTVTYSKTYDEYQIVMPDGTTEYVKYPQEVTSS